VEQHTFLGALAAMVPTASSLSPTRLD
jgi:hypothetical protein